MDLIDTVLSALTSNGPILAVLGSAAGLLFSWARDRQMRRKEYADVIRRAAATTVAKIERWQQIFLGFFQEVQKEVTEADISIIKDNARAADVRDNFWIGVVEAYGRSNQRLLAEELEIAYAHLYGYDPRIHALFQEAIRRLQLISNLCYVTYLNQSQAVIMAAQGSESGLRSAQLGNALRAIVNDRRMLAQESMKSVVEPFRSEVLKLIQASDGSIYRRMIDLKAPDRVFRPESELQAGFAVDLADYAKPDANVLCQYDGFASGGSSAQDWRDFRIGPFAGDAQGEAEQGLASAGPARALPRSLGPTR